ncbi:hypothetical protein GCM10007092_04650 [Thermus composti]|uniref:Serine/threonine protein kinase n=1 Tax=Thermus composti TaxID=532059 RepID=A0ABV6Q3C7_9DEIN|nr:hypothetical protein [Thermus composti]GGM94414.1 hypothetical protein GCM10007092_04650 [Thermus composti]
MEVLGHYWLRRVLVRHATLIAYEGQDTRTGMPVMVLKGAEGEPLEGEGLLALVERTEGGWVLDWPIGAVPLSQYLGVADLDRLRVWVQALAKTLASLAQKGVRHAPIPELVLVKGKRVWLAGVGAKALEGEPGPALLRLAEALAGERFPQFPLKEVLERVARGEAPLEALQEEAEGPKVLEVHAEAPKTLPVEPEEKALPEEPPLPQSRPKVIRIEEDPEPPYPVVEPPRRRGRGMGLGVVLLLALLGVAAYFLAWPGPGASPEVYTMEFRTDPPTEEAVVELLEAPEGSRMAPGVLLTAPGRVEFDRPGVYRLRIRVPGREPVDYLLEVPGPPLTIKVR